MTASFLVSENIVVFGLVEGISWIPALAKLTKHSFIHYFCQAFRRYDNMTSADATVDDLNSKPLFGFKKCKWSSSCNAMERPALQPLRQPSIKFICDDDREQKQVNFQKNAFGEIAVDFIPESPHQEQDESEKWWKQSEIENFQREASKVCDFYKKYRQGFCQAIVGLLMACVDKNACNNSVRTDPAISVLEENYYGTRGLENDIVFRLRYEREAAMEALLSTQRHTFRLSLSPERSSLLLAESLRPYSHLASRWARILADTDYLAVTSEVYDFGHFR